MRQPKKYFRVVYNARVNGKMFRGPNAEAVIDADTFEAALREIRTAVRVEGKYHYGVSGAIEFIRVEPSTHEEFRLFMQDSLGSPLGRVKRSPLENERHMAERRRKRKLAKFRPIKGGRRSRG